MLNYVTLVRQLDILYAVNADVTMAVEIQSGTTFKLAKEFQKSVVFILHITVF